MIVRCDLKVLYIIEVDLDVNNPTSVFKKVLRQTKYWNEHDVSVFSLRSGILYSVENKSCTVLGEGYSQNDSAFIKFKVMITNSKHVLEYANSVGFDIIYSRVLTYTPSLYRLFKKNKVVIEINADDFVEYKLSNYSPLSYIYNRLFGNKLINCSDGFVYLSYELQKQFVYRVKGSIPSVVIANGFDFSGRTIKSSVSDKKPNLVFVISPKLPWNGLDRVMALAKNLQEYNFHVVGELGDNKENIHFHGYLTKQHLDDILLNSDVGVSTMALDKQGMTEASPLKSREYFSFGLPCFGNYDDTDFILNDGVSSTPPLHLKIDEPLDVDRSCTQIRSFVTSWLSLDDRKNKVARVAEQRVSDERKEAERIIFLKEIVSLYD